MGDDGGFLGFLFMTMRPALLLQTRAAGWMDETLYRVLSYAAVLTYIGVLMLTIIAPAAIVSTVSLLGADDIVIERLAVSGFGDGKVFFSGTYALSGTVPCTMRYAPFPFIISYAVPRSNDIHEVGRIRIPELVMGPELSDPDTATITLSLENLEYDYVAGRGTEFYEYYKEEDDMTLVGEATIEGSVHVLGPLWVPMIFNLKWAYGLNELMEVWSPKLPVPRGPEPPRAPVVALP